MSRKFYKTTVTFEVLSEEPINCTDLETLNEQTQGGDWVGHFGETVEVELTAKEAADALYEFGSEPGFFKLDDDGNDIET